ncbi:MAG: tetratricopeptide repeat protein [Myxococcota bacterium]
MPWGTLVLSSLLSWSAPAQVSDVETSGSLEAEALYNAGVERFEAGDFEGALRPLEASLELADDPNTRYAYAQALNQLGRCPEAVREYERVIDLVPEESQAHEVVDQAIRSCASKMAETLASGEEAAAPPPPVVLTLGTPRPMGVGEDPGKTRRAVGIGLMTGGTAGVVIGGVVAAVFVTRGNEFASNLARDNEAFNAADCAGANSGSTTCAQLSGNIDTWRANGNAANLRVVISAAVGVGGGAALLVAGGLLFRDAKRRTAAWKNGRTVGIAPTPGGVLVSGRF